MTDKQTVRFEPRMMIDGRLVETDGTFVNINPATEEVLGEVADGTRADMHRAIDAARRAFDTTDWPTNRELRKRCLEQLQAAIEADREELREELILEAGCPRMITHGPQLDAPLSGALVYRAPLEKLATPPGTPAGWVKVRARTGWIAREKLDVAPKLVPAKN